MSSELHVATINEVEHSLPNFVVIGAMKAGTTSLYQYLKGHDQVFMPTFKELDFFVTESNWRRGLAWYRSQFATAGSALALGEASPAYSSYPAHDGVPERLARLLPGVRLIYLVRDPVERIRSHYQHLVLTGVEKCPPQSALFENPVYLSCSSYAMQLERYLEHFPREQILVITSEALKSDRKATMQQVYAFLGVDSNREPDVLDIEFYRTSQRPTYPPAVLWARRFAKRHMLQARFARNLAQSVLARRPAADVPCASACSSTSSSQDEILPPDLRMRLADELRDDVARLRDYMPADFDGWGYA
jgi:hypothetical protein